MPKDSAAAIQSQFSEARRTVTGGPSLIYRHGETSLWIARRRSEHAGDSIHHPPY